MNKFLLLATILLFVNGIAYSQQKSKNTSNQRAKIAADIEYGTASFYHDKFIGRQTANGELFDQKKLTAAHNNLPLGTWIEVTNLNNNKTVIVRVNDRLHKRNPRLVDLSGAAAEMLGIKGDSLIHVKLEVVNNKVTKKKKQNDEVVAAQ